MKTRSVILKDGVELSEAFTRINLMSPMWTSGRSLFETLLVHPTGKFGLYRERDHITRLLRSADSIGWKGVPPEKTLARWMVQAVTLFRDKFTGYGRMRMTVAWIEKDGDPSTFVTIVPYERPQRPLRLWITDIRLPFFGGLTVPKSGNRLVYELAETLATQRGADEAILVDADGAPLEGSKSNLFVVRGREVFTPRLHPGALAGVTRGQIIKLAANTPYRVREETPDVDWFKDASGFFMTNALWGVRAVAWIDGREVEPDLPVIMALKEAYEQDVREYVEAAGLASPG